MERTHQAEKQPPSHADQWRQPYQLLISASWPAFLAMVTLLYLLIHLFFAALYSLDRQGLGGLNPAIATLAQAFFFSVETMATIGYGAVYPVSLWVHAVVTVEALVGLILVALITGLAFARFARTGHGVRFGERPRLGLWQGTPALMVELRNAGRNAILDVRVQAFWSRESPPAPEPAPPALVPLTLQLPPGVPLEDRFTLVHVIEACSPFFGRTVPEGQVLITFSGIDPILERTIHTIHSYPADAIDWSSPGKSSPGGPAPDEPMR